MNRREDDERKDWKESDRLRERLSDLGVIVQDTKDGIIWRKNKHPECCE